MAVAYISEYSELPRFNGLLVAAPKEPAIAEQNIAIATNTVSAAFNANTKFIRVNVDAVCSLKFSAAGAADPTAVTTAKRMSANTTEFFGVDPGGKVAVIANV